MTSSRARSVVSSTCVSASSWCVRRAGGVASAEGWRTGRSTSSARSVSTMGSGVSVWVFPVTVRVASASGVDSSTSTGSTPPSTSSRGTSGRAGAGSGAASGAAARDLRPRRVGLGTSSSTGSVGSATGGRTSGAASALDLRPRRAFAGRSSAGACAVTVSGSLWTGSSWGAGWPDVCASSGWTAGCALRLRRGLVAVESAASADSVTWGCSSVEALAFRVVRLGVASVAASATGEGGSAGSAGVADGAARFDLRPARLPVFGCSSAGAWSSVSSCATRSFFALGIPHLLGRPWGVLIGMRRATFAAHAPDTSELGWQGGGPRHASHPRGRGVACLGLRPTRSAL